MSEQGDRTPDYPETDPRRIRVVAVHTDDVLTALEARERGRRSAVLRVTPPFSGRIRARIHVEGGEGDYDASGQPLHLDPGSFVDEVPPFPTVDETEDRLRATDSYTVERHREAHEAAVAEWRRALRDHRREELTVETPAGHHRVRVAYLG
jgi:hypothetical protein